MEDRDFLNWFAGFVAGEGFFGFTKPNAWWGARLRIGLRDDNLPILLEIQERLGMGTISLQPESGNSNPVAVLAVCRIQDCQRLVKIFEEFPLRAKKQEEFKIWKEGVLEIARGPRGTYNRRKLAYTEKKLQLVRVYGRDSKPCETLSEIQLDFWRE